MEKSDEPFNRIIEELKSFKLGWSQGEAHYKGKYTQTELDSFLNIAIEQLQSCVANKDFTKLQEYRITGYDF